MAKAEKKRRLFDELMEAAEDINQWREGKITLKTYTIDPQPQIEVTPEIHPRDKGESAFIQAGIRS